MHYLIDGHNLIPRLPGLSLKDPDDEAKLVALLRRWVGADSRRQVTVIFDAGLPAGEARHLSGGGVKAVFASEISSADAVIIKRIEQIKNPTEYTVISSDNAVLAAAARRRVPTQRSEAFAQAMLNDRTFEKRESETRAAAATQEKPQAGPSEVKEWLEIFGPEPERPPAPPPRIKKGKQSAAASEAERERKRKEEAEKKRQAEIEEWLRLFGYKD